MKNDKHEVQARFVEMLSKLTALGKATWVKSEDEPGTIYCCVDDDLIVFEARGGSDAQPVFPNQKVDGIVGKFRNASFLWLEGLHGWDRLLDMLKNAPEDKRQFIQMRRDAHAAPLRVLGRILSD